MSYDIYIGDPDCSLDKIDQCEECTPNEDCLDPCVPEKAPIAADARLRAATPTEPLSQGAIQADGSFGAHRRCGRRRPLNRPQRWRSRLPGLANAIHPRRGRHAFVRQYSVD